MANSSFSSSILSQSEPFTEEQEITFFKSIKMNLQEIQKTSRDIDLKLRNIQKDMLIAVALVNAIESEASNSMESNKENNPH